MPDVAGADTFLADLLEGLDDAAFSSPTASGSFRTKQPATTTPAQPQSQPRKRLKVTQSVTARLASSPSVRALPSPTSLGPGTSPAPSRLLAIPPTPQPFWNDPFARRKLSPAALARRDGQLVDENKEARLDATTPTRAKRSRQREPSSPVKKGTLSARHHETGRGFDVTAPKRVEIEINEPQAQKRQVLAEKGQDKASAAVPAVHLQAPISETDYFDDDFPLDETLWDGPLDSAAAETGDVVKAKEVTPRCRQFTRCMVEEVVEESDHRSLRKVLSVSSEAFDGTRSLILEDDWFDTPVQSGDTINVLGEDGSYDLTSLEPVVISRSSRKLLVLHPDILVSSTKAADSSHCTRKAVLQELIRTVGETTPSLIYGNVLHSLMQACMLENRWDDAFRLETIQQIVKDSGGQLWSVNVSFAKAQEELAERSKEFEAFADRFISVQPKPNAFLSDSHAKESDRSRLAIAAAVAEEEDIWSPRTGLKGKIDVTVLAALSSAGSTDLPAPIPFEIKTGRTNAGMEHRAQTMLYTLLLEDRYDRDVQTGLLMYTQSNDVFAVKRRDNELRGLMQARNRFASHLHDRMTLSSRPVGAASQATESAPEGSRARAATSPAMSEGEAALWDMFRSSPAPPASGPAKQDDSLLPPPIDEIRACRRCYVGNACRVFRIAAGGVEDAPANEELAEIHENAVGHLDESEAAFFARWERLISFEEQELARHKKEIWTLHAEERESLGRCLANMVVAAESIAATVQADEPPAGTTNKSIHRFTYRMRRHATQVSGDSASLLGGAIATNDPVVISLEHPPVLAVARGFVLSTSLHEVVLGLDRSITQVPQLAGRTDGSAVYRIDKDELAAGMGRLRDNLLQLFYADTQTRRRKLVVGLAEPRFDDQAAGDAYRFMPSHLNPDQKAAVEKVLSAQDYALILGMPGTGKTTTTAEIIKALTRARKSVLLTSYTHSAVDNILLKLIDGDGPSILRLGNHDKILPSLRPYALTPADYATSLDAIEEKLMTPQVVATTCLGINEPIFAKRRFDVCIVDEASQVTLPTCLGPLRFADRFVLVGDHYQLPPLVRNKAALEGGLDISLFKRLSDAHPAAVVNLTRQYRMNDDIMFLSNTLVYSNLLRTGDEAIGRRLLTLTEPNATAVQPDWIHEVIDPKRSVLFVDTDSLPARERRDGSLIDNPLEAELVQKIVARLSACGVPEEDIAVLTPYRQQVKLLASQLAGHSAVEVLTADRSQGRDKDCIIISLVRSNTTKNAGDLLKDRRRINVCLTRAKCKLIIVGSRSTVSNAPVMSELLDLVLARDWLYSMPSASFAVVDTPNGSSVTRAAATKTPRRGGGSLAMKRPLPADILNSM